MNDLQKKIGFIGAGNMGEAIISAIIRSHTFFPAMISACDINYEHLERLHKIYGIAALKENFELFSKCDIVILAVKPQQIDEALREITRLNRKIVVSIAAGIPIQRLETRLYAPLDENDRKKLPIIRVMPNTPALVLSGMSGMSPNKHATVKDIKIAEAILESMGKVIKFQEKDLDAVTALSGSGPAYVFYLAEAMINAGLELGLKSEHSVVLTIETLKGAVALMEEMNESPENLRRKVTSPGGTTEAAIKVLENSGVKRNLIKAITAAARRSKELSC